MTSSSTGLAQHGHVFFGDIAVRCYKHKAHWMYDERDIRRTGQAFAELLPRARLCPWLLCAFCNRTLEHCPHLNGCPKADYMNHPPAEHLQLMYPASMEWKPKASTRDRKIGMLGFDPFTDWIPADEADIAPPASDCLDLPDDENVL
ncbi:hypothetical protein ACFRAI_22370 [Streptomyces sp. NPDC056637]|uniref:hypothetical protein n=1 Tax=unclassified Streptomyces TaxID=2593676 RepID=UPI0036812291